MVASQSPTSFSRYPIRSSVELRVNTCTFHTSVSGEDELGFFWSPHVRQMEVGLPRKAASQL